MYYLNSRYYNPQIGRFISADSISYLDPSSETGLNLYAYCGNNPVMYVDSTGEFFISIALISSLVIGVAKILIAAAVAYAVVKTVEVIANAVENAENEQKKDSWTVYALKDSAGVVQYVGRIKNPVARKRWHTLMKPGLAFKRLDENLTYAEARGLEQMYMIQYDTVHKGSFMNNQINGISPNNPRAGEYFLAGLKKIDNQIENALLNLFGG